jgi:hypothetical protein
MVGLKHDEINRIKKRGVLIKAEVDWLGVAF